MIEGTYRDSVSLMLAAQAASRLDGVQGASAVSATPINLELLRRDGFASPEMDAATPADLIVAVRAAEAEAVEAALEAIRTELRGGGGDTGPSQLAPPRSITAAARRTDANLAVISVPGDRAAYECATALEAGLNVFCFSSGFDAATELALKRRALELGLLMMGPDCGTAILDGTGIGFANQVAPGPVGIVAASGTGAQQVSCLLDSAGVGISQLIGVGGRDLGGEVHGAMSARAISILGADPATECIVVVGKSPDPGVAQAIAEHAAETGKPAVLALGEAVTAGLPEGVRPAGTLEDAASLAAELAGATLEAEGAEPVPPHRPGAVRGLFSGGTLRDEALGIAAGGMPADSPPLSLDNVSEDLGDAHAFIDFGSEELTRGRPHPMIDPQLRNDEVARQADDPEVGVILADVVLGRCSHPDPAAGLAEAIEPAGGDGADRPAFVVSLCGAERDPQGLADQEERLTRAGATVARSNARAARIALEAAGLELGESGTGSAR